MLDDKITDQCTEEHGNQGEGNDLHAFQGTTVFLREEHLDPDGCRLADQHVANANQEHKGEQMQIIKTEEVGSIDAVGAGDELADAEETHRVNQDAGKADLGDLAGVDDLGEGNGNQGCQQQGNTFHQTHIAGGQADIIDQPVAQVGKVEIEGDEEHAVDTAGQQHFLQVGIFVQSFQLEHGDQLLEEGAVFMGLYVGMILHKEK